MKVLVTGAAGFIGFHVSRRLLEEGLDVVGLDNLNDYYSVQLKLDRLSQLGIHAEDISDQRFCLSRSHPRFRFIKGNLEDRALLEKTFNESYSVVINLAGQAGVRYSKEDPSAFIQTNIVGFANILEFSQRFGIKHLIYASSSSVYGQYEGKAEVGARVDQPVSLYAATKRSNELLAQAYNTMYGLPTTGLRFFTVYGPWGRPDAAYYLFTEALKNGSPIQLYNYGKMWRDFTYIDDVVEGITRTVFQKPEASSKVFNIGTGHSIQITEFLQKLKNICGEEGQVEKVPGHPEDIRFSCADTSELFKNIGFQPQVHMQAGLTAFVRWYDQYTSADQRQPS